MAELIVRREGGIGRIIVSNIARRNAMTYEMYRELPGVVRELGDDPSVRLVVISGDGKEAFVSGGDISEFETVRATPAMDAQYMRAVDEASLCPLRCDKPVIAKIRGFCMGGGLALAAGCDVRIAASDAKFCMPAARLGVGFWFEGMQRLVQVLGPTGTADIFFSARVFGAEEALRMGFLNQVVSPEELDRAVDAYCNLVLQNAPLTLMAAKASIRQTFAGDHERDLAGLDALFRRCWASEDYREGRDAFLQKRKPQFKGR